MDRTERLAHARARLGQTVGDGWKLYGVLGSGGTATVYAAAHAHTNAKAAVKILHRWVAEGTPRATQRMLREAQAAAAIGHPAICDVIESGEHDQSPFIAFEWLEGLNLEHALARGKITPPRFWNTIGDVLDALDAAHRADIVHRDLKPANIFVLDQGPVTAKLLDFGAARYDGPAIDTITTDGALIGTIPYMSPEQARGERVQLSSDLYAVGATIFRAVRGRPPFIGATAFESLHLIATSRPPTAEVIGRDVPEAITQIIRRALASSPEDRWPSARAMRDAIADVDQADVERLKLPLRRKKPVPPPPKSSENATVRAPAPVPADFDGSRQTELASHEASLVVEQTAQVVDVTVAAPAPTIVPREDSMAPIDAPDTAGRRFGFGRLAALTWIVAVAIISSIALLASQRAPTPTPPTTRPVQAETQAVRSTTTSPPAARALDPAPKKKAKRKRRRRPRKRRPAVNETKIDDVLLEEI